MVLLEQAQRPSAGGARYLTKDMSQDSHIQMRKMHYPLLLKLLLLFIFFLPLRSIQIPVNVIGFEINPARIASTLLTIFLFMNICVDFHYLRNFFHSGRSRNVYVLYFFVYTLFSIGYYYLLVASEKTLLFGAGEASFLRNWRGRPLAQLLALITYGIIPFYLVRYYAQYERARRSIERVFTWAILLLTYFACTQVITYIIFRVPLMGRQLLEYKYDLGAIDIFGLPFYRVNSLAGEPRDFGAFLLGAILFYAYVYSGRMNLFTKATLFIMILAFFLTTSNSALLALGIFLIIAIVDIVQRRRIRLRFKYIKYLIVLVLIGIVVFRTQIVDSVGKRSVLMYEAIVAQLQTQETQPVAREQTSNIVILYYLLNIFGGSPVSLLFGSGYSNFITPVADLYRSYFNREVEDVGILTSDSFAGRIFIEEGIVGLALYGMMGYRTLQINGKLLAFFKKRKDRQGYQKALLLRFAFLAFFIAGSVQISYYYFIIMGLIIGWLNGALRMEKDASVRVQSSEGNQLIYGEDR